MKAEYEAQIEDLRQDQAEVKTEKADVECYMEETPKDEEIAELRAQMIDLETKKTAETRQLKAQITANELVITRLKGEVRSLREINCNMENRKQLG